MNILESRRHMIESEFEKIDSLEQDVQEIKSEYSEKLKDIEGEARLKMQEAINDGRRIATEIADKARDDAKNTLEKAKQHIILEMAKARTELKDDVIRLTLATTEKLLKEKIDEKKHRQLITSFIDEMESLSDRN